MTKTGLIALTLPVILGACTKQGAVTTEFPPNRPAALTSTPANPPQPAPKSDGGQTTPLAKFRNQPPGPSPLASPSPSPSSMSSPSAARQQQEQNQQTQSAESGTSPQSAAAGPPPTTSLPATPETQDPQAIPVIYTYGVDLRDIIRYKTARAAEARAILQDIKSRVEAYFPSGVKYSDVGPTLALATRDDAVYSITFSNFATEQDFQIVSIDALYKSHVAGAFFRSFNVTLGGSPLKVQDVVIARDIPVSQVRFKMRVGLMQRKMILTEETYNLKLVYPIGLGGFDEGVTSPGKLLNLSPRFKKAFIERRWVEPSRTDPDYYKGRPFIRLSSSTLNYTPFGFHYSIDPVLHRGFVSHGCFRMRDKDLYEFFVLVMNEANPTIPVEMRYWLDDPADNPYPLVNASYERVKNFGTPEEPATQTDEHNLVIMEHHVGTPPTHGFTDDLQAMHFLMQML